MLYRLSALYVQQLDADSADVVLAKRWLWLLEWPAVRLLGLSWALAGNFVGCFQQWSESVLCMQRPSDEVLQHYLAGALGVTGLTPAESATDRESVHEIKALRSLFSRSLAVWLSFAALFILFG